MCRWALSLIVVGILASEAQAAVPRASSTAKRAEASHIVVGKVSRVYSSTGPVEGSRREVFLVAEIAVEKVEKGSGMAAGDTLFARYWRADWLGDPKAIPMDATTCISPRPEAEDSVRVYLGLNQTNGLGARSGRGYNVLFPNGFEILRSKKSKGNYPPPQ